MFSSEDFQILIDEADNAFNSLPFQSRFFFKWLKVTAKPLSASYTLVFEAVPSFLIPPKNISTLPSLAGDLTREEYLEIAIPRKFGETVELEGIVYVNGIEIHDVIESQEGIKYIVTRKERRGYGAYYVLGLTAYKGMENSWLQGQYGG